nr:heparinase II/III family protein [Halomonas sp. ISL-56]
MVELERCVVKKIERTVTTSSNVSLGEKLFTAKKLELAPFAAVNFTGWGSWEQDPLNNRSWQWRLNWLSFLSYILAYHHRKSNDAILNSGKKAIESWLNAYLDTDTEYSFEFIWHDHATALRAEQLVLFSYYCRDKAPEWSALNTEFLEYLENALIVHGEWLAKDSFYSEHTNHGLEQARVLLLLGTVFEGKQAEEWQQIAIQRISSELQFAFTDEGVHVENSPAYHIFVFKVFLGIIKDYPDKVLGDLASQFSQFSAKALNFITHILRPDGLLPPIGDTEQLPTTDAYKEMFGSTNEYQHFLYALSQGKQGVKPEQLNVVYPKSGYAVFRDCWPGSEKYKQALHAIVKVGCSSRYHHQQDEGHVSIYAGGEDWLIDSGLYNYINKDPIRKYMRGRPGHNVPIVSNASYDKEFEHRLSAWRVIDYSEREVLPHVAMQLEVLRPVVQTRQVCFSPVDKELTIADHFVSEDNQSRNFTLQWHIPKNKTVTVNGNQINVESALGQKMMIEFDGPEPDNISVVKGVKQDKVFSCISYKANHYEPSQVIKVAYTEYADLAIKTCFSFEHVLPDSGSNGEVNSVVSNTPEFASKNIISYLYDKVRRETPLVVVACGAEEATIGIAKALRENGIGRLVILENSEERAEKIKKNLKENYLQSWVEWRMGDLTPWQGDDFNVSPAQQKACWFPLELIEDLEAVDFVWVADSFNKDSNFFCYLALPALLERLSTQTQIWVNGISAPIEEELCKQWAEHHGFEFEYLSRKNGLGVLSRR